MADRVKDISEEVADAKAISEGPSDPWQDYINWKGLRREGWDAVQLDGKVYDYNKWGLLDERKATGRE